MKIISAIHSTKNARLKLAVSLLLVMGAGAEREQCYSRETLTILTVIGQWRRVMPNKPRRAAKKSTRSLQLNSPLLQHLLLASLP